MDSKKLGILFCVLAGLMWATETLFSKYAFQNNADFLQVSFFRGIFVCLAGFLYVIFLNKANFSISKKQFSVVLYVSVAATLIADVTFVYALTQIPIVNANLMAHLQPVFILLLGFLFFQHEKLSKNDYLGVFLMLAAAFLVVTRTTDNLFSFRIGMFGDFLVLGSAFVWATTTIAIKNYLQDLNVGLLMFYRFLISSLVFVFFFFVAGQNPYVTFFQVLVGIVTGIGFAFYYNGLKRLKAAQASSLELVSPFFAALLGVFFLGENITLMQVFGVFLLFIGGFFLSKREN